MNRARRVLSRDEKLADKWGAGVRLAKIGTTLSRQVRFVRGRDKDVGGARTTVLSLAAKAARKRCSASQSAQLTYPPRVDRRPASSGQLPSELALITALVISSPAPRAVVELPVQQVTQIGQRNLLANL